MSSGLGRASALLASGTIVSRVLGFVRSFVLTIVFLGQVNIVGNALTVSNQMPTSLYALIGGGLVSAVLVPQTIRASRGADGGVAYINKLVTIAVVAIGSLTVLLTLAAPLLMKLTVSDQHTYDAAVPFGVVSWRVSLVRPLRIERKCRSPWFWHFAGTVTVTAEVPVNWSAPLLAPARTTT